MKTFAKSQWLKIKVKFGRTTLTSVVFRVCVFFFNLAKFEEQEANIPRSMDLNGYVTGPGFTSNEYLQMELLLLNFFDWKVSFPTPAHFTEHYMQLSQDENDTLNGKPIESFIRVLEHLRKYTNYFLEISLQGRVLDIRQPPPPSQLSGINL